MKRFVEIKKKIKPFNKILEIEGDKVYQLGGLY